MAKTTAKKSAPAKKAAAAKKPAVKKAAAPKVTAPVKRPKHQNTHESPEKLRTDARPGSCTILKACCKTDSEKRKIFFHISNSLYKDTTRSSMLSPSTEISLISVCDEI